MHNVGGACGVTVSEHVLALILLLYKKLCPYHDNQRQSLWEDEGGIVSLSSMKVLVTGVRDVDSHYTRLYRVPGSYIIGVRRTVNPPMEEFDKLHVPDKLDRLLPKADAVATALPCTPETQHSVDGHHPQLMEPGTLLISGGRSKTVDQ